MEENTDIVVQERNAGPRKGFYYNTKAGGYTPCKSKPGEVEPKKFPVRIIVLLVIGVVALLAYIFRDKLKTLWLKKTKEALTS
jgi:hypothetical protein